MTSAATSLPGLPNLIGRSAPFMAALELIRRMARCEAPVLIQGETGTGKELAARAIHYLSARRNGPFVPLNCGAVPETLIETELFGCARGAFTDAREAREGLAAAADGGTLFLDEVDALPLRAQVALLRFLQEHLFRRVGATREEHSNVRVLAAASPRLARALREGSFRDDLAFRLDVLSLQMPALRERGDDVLLLAEHFARFHATVHGVQACCIDAAGRHWLQAQAWPGNVRELMNVIQRAVLLGDGQRLQLGSLGRALPGAVTAEPALQMAADFTLPSYSNARAEALRNFEQQYLEAVMTTATGNVSRAARLAGKERRAMGKLLKRHGIDRGRFS
jgi:DNA-binding NtrC family response regulator